MQTHEAVGEVRDGGSLHVDIDTSLPPGSYRVVFVEEQPVERGERPANLLGLPVTRGGTWPAALDQPRYPEDPLPEGTTFRREDLYDDWGVDDLFVDTNILIYSTYELAELHEAALRALDDAVEHGTRLQVSEQIPREYLVSSTRGATPMKTMMEAVAAVETIRSTFTVLPIVPAVTSRLLTIIQQASTAGKQIHDANIVATMLVHGIPRLLTHNVVDFRRFEPLIEITPLTTA